MSRLSLLFEQSNKVILEVGTTVRDPLVNHAERCEPIDKDLSDYFSSSILRSSKPDVATVFVLTHKDIKIVPLGLGHVTEIELK